MKIRTIEDILSWLVSAHRELICLLNKLEVSKLNAYENGLVYFLIKHEEKLSRLLEMAIKNADKKALGTYVYDYKELDSKPEGIVFTRCSVDINYDNISEDIINIHELIIEKIDSILGRAGIPEEIDLLESLLHIEKTELRQMVQQINRGRDL